MGLYNAAGTILPLLVIKAQSGWCKAEMIKLSLAAGPAKRSLIHYLS